MKSKSMCMPYPNIRDGASVAPLLYQEIHACIIKHENAELTGECAFVQRGRAAWRSAKCQLRAIKKFIGGVC